MIKNITNEQFITYRYKFIMAGIKYIPELKNYYKPYIDENKNHFLQYILPSLFLNSNRYISNNNNKTGKKVDSQNNTEINKTNNNNVQTKQITPNKSVINSTKDDDSRQKIERETKNKFII